MPTSKYQRQIINARRLIAEKGTTCTWVKSENTDTTDDPTPEFPKNDDPLQYANVPIVLIPANRQSLLTIIPIPALGQNTDQTSAYIPGDVPFSPANGDRVLIASSGDEFVVETVNTTQPDGIPVIHELFFK